jgi:hypothetical protein
MKTQSWRIFSIAIPCILLLALSATNWSVQASNLLGPTPYVPPAQGCNSATGIGTDYKTCAFYVTINEDDAGNKPECNSTSYSAGWPEIYFGRCNNGADSIVSGFRFQNVSVPIPSNQKVLASYIELTVDGTYGPNTITSNIYGQASTSPNSFNDSITDLLTRPTVQPTALWSVPSTNTANNMGDLWSLGDTRRTPDVTSILTAILGPTGWQNNNSIALLFKTMTASPTSSRRVLAKERVGFNPARLVVRVGEIPRPSVSYYWESATYNKQTNSTTFDAAKLTQKAIVEAQRNRPVLVILDFGNPYVTSTKIGTRLLNQTKAIASTTELLGAAQTYISAFVANAQGNSQLWLGVGTNNAGDALCSTQTASDHGAAWASMMEQLQNWVIQQNYNAVDPNKIKVSAANDIETWKGYRLKCVNQLRDPAPAANALAWAYSYAQHTEISYINYGTVEGNTANASDWQTVWEGDTVWELSWGIPEAYPLPEIYIPSGANAADWQKIARMSVICTGCLPETRDADPSWAKGRDMQFLGALTNYGQRECSTGANSPNQGWLQLYRNLAVDLNTDFFPIYSSDITFELSSNNTADTCPTP